MYAHLGLWKEIYKPQSVDEIPRNKGMIDSVGYAEFRFNYIQEEKIKTVLFNGMDSLDKLIAIETNSRIDFKVKDEVRIGNAKYEIQKVVTDRSKEVETTVYRFPHLNRSIVKRIVLA
jgi:hypothetical protein